MGKLKDYPSFYGSTFFLHFILYTVELFLWTIYQKILYNVELFLWTIYQKKLECSSMAKNLPGNLLALD